MKPESPTAWPYMPAIVALMYAATGWAALALTIAPGFGSPLFPAAGVAVIGVMLYGRRVLPGLWLASFAVNLTFARGFGAADMLSVGAIACGSTAQAAFAVWLVRRYCRMPLALTEPREIALFFALAGPVACVVSSSVGVTTLVAGGLVPGSSWLLNWGTWWAGDSLGVLIAAPILLAFAGWPRSLWRPRIRSVAVPLLIVTALAGLAMEQARRWEHARSLAIFEGTAVDAQEAVARSLELPLHAIQALHGLYVASGDVSAEEFAVASQIWTADANAAQSLSWAERVSADALGAHEQAARAEVGAGYRVFDLSPRGERIPPADGSTVEGPGSELMPVRYVAPATRRPAELGLNVMSHAARRDAVSRARRTDALAASPSFALTEDPNDTGVVVYRAIYRGDPMTEAQRMHQTRGVIGLTVRIGAALQPVLAELPEHLEVCLVDKTADGAPLRLAGAPGCETAQASPFRTARSLQFAQRTWELWTSPRGGVLPGLARPDRWLFSVITVLAAATFGALLLTMTGRTRRIQAAVDERTAALQREIAERARTEAALRDSEQRFRNILNHVPIGVIYSDLQGCIKQSNPMFREMVGYSVEELDQMRAIDFTHPDDRLEDIELTRRLVHGELNVYQRQKRFLRADGNHLWARVVVSLLRDAKGAPHRIVGVVEDITEHLRLREAEDARELAEAANRAKSEFLSRMSHELRTPLNAMLGFAQLIDLDREQALSSSQREWLGQIQTAGWHLLDMINDTLDLSRIESGTLKLDIMPMDLSQTLAATIPMIERSAQARGLAISQSLSPEASRVHGDATRVKQILTNLLTNAVKYNVDAGRIDIATRLNVDGQVELTVADSGLGMTREQLGSLFQPFNRLGRERSVAEGTGIGLVISQRLAELMGGRLSVASTEGRGSVFTLTLPRAVTREAPRHTEEDPGQGPHDYRQRVVHYIEDNETNAVVMQGILAQRPQVALRVSSSGLDGLASIRANPPSLILLDMHLPDIDGLQLLRMLKDDVNTAAIPVVAVSADAVAGRINAALEVGAEYYLTKPVNISELLRLLDQLLEERDTLFG
jgi:PAS domain S-box-containing protein